MLQTADCQGTSSTSSTSSLLWWEWGRELLPAPIVMQSRNWMTKITSRHLGMFEQLATMRPASRKPCPNSHNTTCCSVPVLFGLDDHLFLDVISQFNSLTFHNIQWVWLYTYAQTHLYEFKNSPLVCFCCNHLVAHSNYHVLKTQPIFLKEL